MRSLCRLFALLLVLTTLGGIHAAQSLPPDFLANAPSPRLSFFLDGPGLLSDFVILSAGVAGVPVYTAWNPAWTYWHPAAAAFSRPALFYSHSVRHFPASAIVSAGGKRRNVDQLDADLVVFTRPSLWGGVARFFSVAGEWGFDHQAQRLTGFPKRRADGRLEGFARARALLPWLVHGCSNSTVRFRGYSSGRQFAFWSSKLSRCGAIIRIFPWFSFGFARGGVLSNGSSGFSRVSSSGTSSLFAGHLAVFRWLSVSSLAQVTPPGIFRAFLFEFPAFAHGNYEFSASVFPGVRRASVLSLRLSLLALTLGFGEIKDAIPLFLPFPGDRPENLTPPPVFRDIHIAYATLSP